MSAEQVEFLEQLNNRMADQMASARRMLEAVAGQGGDMLSLEELAKKVAGELEACRLKIDKGIGRELRPFVIHCTNCGKRHVDRDEWATLAEAHHTHKCAGCGALFKPKPYATVGV